VDPKLRRDIVETDRVVSVTTNGDKSLLTHSFASRVLSAIIPLPPSSTGQAAHVFNPFEGQSGPIRSTKPMSKAKQVLSLFHALITRIQLSF
jgi:hypothetical protein